MISSKGIKLLNKLVRPLSTHLHLQTPEPINNSTISKISIFDDLDLMISHARKLQNSLEEDYLRDRIKDKKKEVLEIMHNNSSEYLMFMDAEKLNAPSNTIESELKSLSNKKAKILVQQVQTNKQKNVELSLNLSNEQMVVNILEQIEFHNFVTDHKGETKESNLESESEKEPNESGNKLAFKNVYLMENS